MSGQRTSLVRLDPFLESRYPFLGSQNNLVLGTPNQWRDSGGRIPWHRHRINVPSQLLQKSKRGSGWTPLPGPRGFLGGLENALARSPHRTPGEPRSPSSRLCALRLPAHNTRLRFDANKRILGRRGDAGIISPFGTAVKYRMRNIYSRHRVFA